METDYYSNFNLLLKDILDSISYHVTPHRAFRSIEIVSTIIVQVWKYIFFGTEILYVISCNMCIAMPNDFKIHIISIWNFGSEHTAIVFFRFYLSKLILAFSTVALLIVLIFYISWIGLIFIDIDVWKCKNYIFYRLLQIL